MPKSYHSFESGQMIMTFADLKGDLLFLKQSLALYKEAYRQAFPQHPLTDDDFTVVGDIPIGDEPYIKFPENVICVNLGDLLDKTQGNRPRSLGSCNNLKLLHIFYNTHRVCAMEALKKGEKAEDSRMISLLGPRDIVKLRFIMELNSPFIIEVLRQEIDYFFQDPNNAEKKGLERPRSMVWVGESSSSFLEYLQASLVLPEGWDRRRPGDDEITRKRRAYANIFNHFEKLKAEEQIILYLKWMLKHSCAAPDLWHDFTAEIGLMGGSDEEIKRYFLFYFSYSEGLYHSYLDYCQLGVQIGSILFTHAGIDDNSFRLPSSLIHLFSSKELKKIFPQGVPQDLMAENMHQLLVALNTWYGRFKMHLRAYQKHLLGFYVKCGEELLIQAYSELLDMSLPRTLEQGNSLLSGRLIDENGAYGNPLNSRTQEKLLFSAQKEPIFIAIQGHRPAAKVCFSRHWAKDDDSGFSLDRIGINTSYFRSGQAALALSITKDNGFTRVKVYERDGMGNTSQTFLTSRDSLGQLFSPCNVALDKSNPLFFLGKSLMLAAEETSFGWNLIAYDSKNQEFLLFRQRMEVPEERFKPESRWLPVSEVAALLNQLGLRPKTWALRDAVYAALIRYQAYFQAPRKSMRADWSLFSPLRHGVHGQDSAKHFVDEMLKCSNIGNYCLSFLTAQDRRYHANSFSSYLLDALETYFLPEKLKLPRLKSEPACYHKDGILLSLQEVFNEVDAEAGSLAEDGFSAVSLG